MCKNLSAKKWNVVIVMFVRKTVGVIILKIEAENEPYKYEQKYFMRLEVKRLKIIRIKWVANGLVF